MTVKEKQKQIRDWWTASSRTAGVNSRVSSNHTNCEWIKHSGEQEALAGWMRQHDPTVCCQQETHFRSKASNKLRVKWWKWYAVCTGTKRELERLCWCQAKQTQTKTVIETKRDTLYRKKVCPPWRHHSYRQTRICKQSPQVQEIKAAGNGERNREC